MPRIAWATLTSISFGADAILYVHDADGNRVRLKRTSPKCRTGCPTQDHKSYSECARGLEINVGMSGTTRQKAHDAELRAYRRARDQGIQPAGTKMHQVEDAMRKSDASGVAFGS